MNAQRLLQTVSAVLFKNLPAGLSRADVLGFLQRNQGALLAVIQKQYDQMCRLNVLLPGVESRIGYAVLEPDSSGQIAVFGADVGSSPTTGLAVKARCHPKDPQVLRQFAVHSRREDETTWRLHPGATWEGTEAEAIRAFLKSNLQALRWWEGSVDAGDEGIWEGNEDGSIVLEDTWAQRTAAELLQDVDLEEERDRKQIERQQADYEKWKREQRKRPAASSAPSKELPESPVDVAQAVPAGTATPTGPVKTPWGGVRAEAPLEPISVKQGQRVVTRDGLHGTVTKALSYTVTSTRMNLSRMGVDPEVRSVETRYDFDLKLDSGRSLHMSGPLFEEIAPPTAVVPDISFDGGKSWLAPAEAWKQVVSSFDHIAYLEKKSRDARKPQYKQQLAQGAERSQAEFKERMQIFTDWRLSNPDVAVDRLDPLIERRLQLEAQVTGLGRRMFGQGYKDELQWLSSAPPDWKTRFQPGDKVTVPIFYEERKLETTSDRIARIEADKAHLASGGAPVLLYYLRLDERADAPTSFTKPHYLVELAGDLLASENGRAPSISRGVFSRAIKTFLAGHSIPVRPDVDRGGWISSVRLQPPVHGRWTEEMVTRMNELLPGLRARSDEATFYPLATKGRDGNLMADDFGTPSGLLFPPEQAAKLAPYLAKSLKDGGMTLSREGEAWLRLDRATTTAVPADGGSGTSTSRGGATATQRQAAADGCIDISFTLEGFGLVRVVCGQAGRRDLWHNVHTPNRRFGFNGGRWARGLKPPEKVLQAIRERGITAFDEGVERLEAPTPNEIELRLNVDELIPPADGAVELLEGDALEYLCACDRSTVRSPSARNTDARQVGRAR